MALSQRRKRFVRRLLGYATNPVAVRARSAMRRDQSHLIGGLPVLLPPEHNLPFYQRRDPTYDAYAAELVGHLAPRSVTLIDLGANVGDTAVAVLATGPEVRVVCIEGSTRFLPYLRRNLAPFGDRVRVVDRFVGPVGDRTSFAEANGTGNFQPTGKNTTTVTDWVTPRELLSEVAADVVVWKSDVDGFDIHILVEHWDVISSAADILWFEFAPSDTLGDQADIGRLCALLGASGRVVRVYDNLGRPMLPLAPGASTEAGLLGLAEWLRRQRYGHVAVPYLDVWAAVPDAADIFDVVHAPE